MGEARLLEREELLCRLEEHLTASRHGSGRLVFIGGEAGVGKTSLLRRFTANISDPIQISWGACEDMAAPTPLGPLLDIADDQVEDAQEFIGWRARRYRLFSSVLASLRASTRPRLLVFEDLHWADEATFDLLRFLSRRVADAPALLLATYRDDELAPESGLRRLLGDVAAAATVHRLSVPPLSVDAVGELARELNVDPVAVHARTRGNPFFVTEVLAAGGEGLPGKLSDAIAARTSRLSPPARHALELASAFLPHELNADSLSALAPAPEAIDECMNRGLLVGTGRDLRFRHELVREAVAAATPLSRRRAAHAAILAWLEGEDPTTGVSHAHVGREAVSALAHHAAEAGDGAATLRYSTAAGRLAMKYQANREARIQFLRALPLSDALPPEERAQLFQDHAKVCCVTGNFAESIEPSLKAVTTWRQVGRAAKTAQVLLLLAEAYHYLGHDAEYRRSIDEAERLVEGASREEGAGGDTRSDWELVLDCRAMIYLERGAASYPDVSALEAWAAKAEACWREQGSPKALAVMQRLQGLARAARRSYRAGLRCFERSLETATANDHDDLLATGHLAASMALHFDHRYRLTDASLEQALELGLNWDAAFTVDRALAWQSTSHLYQGRWSEAEAVAASLLERPKACLAARVKGLITLGRLRLRRGDARAAEPLEEARYDCEHAGVWSQLLGLQVALLEWAQTSGAPVPDATLERARQVLALARTSHPARRAELAYWLWQAGEPPTPPEGAVGDPFALQLQGRAAAAARRWRRLGCPYEEARALVEVDEPDALRRAHLLFTELGARPAAARTSERLRRKGVKGVAGRPPANPSALTPRERQVLTLMRMGLRNAEIARANQVSPRTVDHQVSSVLAKLGARTRTEAVSLAERLGVTAD